MNNDEVRHVHTLRTIGVSRRARASGTPCAMSPGSIYSIEEIGSYSESEAETVPVYEGYRS